MIPPHNESISKETGIKESRLYNWRKLARQAGNPTPGNGKSSDKWSSQVIFKTASRIRNLCSVQ